MAEIPPHERRTGLFVVVPADDLVGDFRRRHHAASVARELPPHVTIVFPFVVVSAVDDGLRAELAAHFSSFEPFQAELVGVGAFRRHAWLAPEPRHRFVELMKQTRERFHDRLPRKDELDEPVPHLTIGEAARGDSVAVLADRARTELGPQLPFGFAVDAIGLLEEGADGKWHELSRFELG
jgi:2'-5' RNA ligase